MGGDDSQKLLALERNLLLSGAQQTSGFSVESTLYLKTSVLGQGRMPGYLPLWVQSAIV